MSLSSESPRGSRPSLGSLVLYALIAFLFLVFALMPRTVPAAVTASGAEPVLGGFLFAAELAPYLATGIAVAALGLLLAFVLRERPS